MLQTNVSEDESQSGVKLDYDFHSDGPGASFVVQSAGIYRANQAAHVCEDWQLEVAEGQDVRVGASEAWEDCVLAEPLDSGDAGLIPVSILPGVTLVAVPQAVPLDQAPQHQYGNTPTAEASGVQGDTYLASVGEDIIMGRRRRS